MIESNAQQMMDEMLEAQNEVIAMIDENRPSQMKDAFVHLMQQHHQNSQQALNDLSLLYLLVKARSELEEQTCSMDQFAKYTMDFANQTETCLDFYRHNIQPLTYMSTLLKNLTRDELYAYCKAIGLKGCSSYKKQELLETLSNALIDPEVMEEQLAGVNDEAMEFFDRLSKENVHRLTEKEKDYIMHFPFAYICKSGNDDVFLCEQVKRAYRKIDQESFNEKRQKTLFLNGLSYLIENSYGFLSDQEAMELVRIHPLFANEEDVKEMMKLLVEKSDKALVHQKGFIGKPSYLKDANFKKALSNQEKLPLGIPSLKEIEDLGYYHFPYFRKSYKNMLKVAVQQGLSLEAQHEMMQYMYQQLSFHHEVAQGLKLLSMYGIDESDAASWNLVKAMLYDTRCLTYHGLTVEEFEQLQKKAPAKKKEASFVPLNAQALKKQQLLQKIQQETNNNPFATMLFHKIQKEEK